MTDRAKIHEELVEAIAWWIARLPNAQEVLADAATDALLAGADGSALAELAGLPPNENAFEVDVLIDRVVDELDLDPERWSNPELVAVRRMCRELLDGRVSERELSGWVHTRFHHESDSEPLDRLAELDDEYDELEDMNEDLVEIRKQIRKVAASIVG